MNERAATVAVDRFDSDRRPEGLSHQPASKMDTEKLDCGHPHDEGSPANVGGKIIQGWTFVLRDGKRICHACDMLRVVSCGHHPSPHSEHTTGTAHTPDGREICYVCADAEQCEALRDRSRPFSAYLSSDGKTVTTWTGGHLGNIIGTTTVRLARWSAFHGKTMQAVRFRDIHGGLWHGRGSPGICIRLRPTKGA